MMPRKPLVKQVRTLVVKVGTSTISEEGKLSGRRIACLVEDIADLMDRGYRIALVSSGAISAGLHLMNRVPERLTIPVKQALAAVGQTLLMNEYRRHFEKRGLQVGQILLTEDDIENRRRFINARHTINVLFEMGVMPIVNENDSVVVKEIKFGDNDTLSAHVASLVDAELLVILSDIDGFYMDMSDPAPREEISEITEDIWKRAGDRGTRYGTGGMITKLRAAEIMLKFGEKTIIARGGKKNVLNSIMNGEKIGTIFASTSPPLPSKKKWLFLGKSRGRLTIDAGAVRALSGGKKSLLAGGILSHEGRFDMGDLVDIVDGDGKKLGKGLANYNSEELAMIRGKKTSEIRELMQGNFFEEVINRDDLLMYE